MERFRKGYLSFTVALLVVFSLVQGLAFLWTESQISDIFRSQAEESLIQSKRVFLKDTVNNQILRIEDLRERGQRQARETIELAALYLERTYQAYPGDFLDRAQETLLPLLEQAPLTVVVFDKDQKRGFYYDALEGSYEVPYQSKLQRGDADVLEKALSMEEDLVQAWTGHYGNNEILLAVRSRALDQQVQQSVAQEIHRSVFAEDSYLWVNEVVNYEGGDNYAIRRIHPNLKNTEGQFLSTSMTDIQGSQPYLEELEGVKENGELFFTYFFKKKGTDAISEKLTYARLYKPYNWIVAMGIHLDDVQAYVDETNLASRGLTSRMVMLLILFFLSSLFLASLIFTRLEKWYHHKTRAGYQEKIYTDILTKALNRTGGEEELQNRFVQFKKGLLPSPALFMFDVDNFKSVNDQYGHDVGDKVLISLVKAVQEATRKSDRLFRWGGEEFLLICPGLPATEAKALADNLMEKIRQAQYPAIVPLGSISVSMGIAFFSAQDEHQDQAVKRADEGLYQAKGEGKNKAILIEALEHRPFE